MGFAYGVTLIRNRGSFAASSPYRKRHLWSPTFHGKRSGDLSSEFGRKLRFGSRPGANSESMIPVLMVSYMKELSGVIVNIPASTKNVEEDVFAACNMKTDSFTGVLFFRGEKYSKGYAHTLKVDGSRGWDHDGEGMMSELLEESVGKRTVLDLGSKSTSSSVTLYSAPSLEVLGVDTSDGRWNTEFIDSNQQPQYLLFLYPKTPQQQPKKRESSRTKGGDNLVGGKRSQSEPHRGGEDEKLWSAAAAFSSNLTIMIDTGRLYIPAGNYVMHLDQIKACYTMMLQSEHNVMEFISPDDGDTARQFSFQISDKIKLSFE